MKFSFGCLSAVLAPVVVVMAKENEHQPVGASTVISDNILNSKKENVRGTSSSSSSSPYSKVKGTVVYKKLSDRADVRIQPNQLRNSKLVATADVDKEVENVDVVAEVKVNKEAAGITEAAAATATTAGTTSTTTATTTSGAEECVPPVTVTNKSNLDSGNLPLSSCSSKKQLCINVDNQGEPSSSSSIKKKTGSCLDIWDVPITYMAIKGPNNEDTPSTYWEGSSSTGTVATSVAQKEDAALLYTTTSDQLIHYHDDRMYQQGEGDYHSSKHRNLDEIGDCDVYCSANSGRPKVSKNGKQFKNVIQACYEGDNSCPYEGPINCWDVSDVESMDYAFKKSYFNDPLTCWDTSAVKTMAGMFVETSYFDQDINSWSIGKVEDMSYMFQGAAYFDSPLDEWNTESVTTMESTFEDAYFNQDINSWVTTKVENMVKMFYNNDVFDSPIDSWDTSSVSTMKSMFSKATLFNSPINEWNIEKVQNLEYMFYEASSFNQALDGWNTGEVTSLLSTFSKSPFNQDINSWVTSAVTSLGATFYDAVKFSQPLGAWDTKKVESLDSTFYNAVQFDQPIGNWDTKKVTTMAYLFGCGEYCDGDDEDIFMKFNQDINSWKTYKVNDFSYTFVDNDSFNNSIGNWDTSEVTDMQSMFAYAGIFNSDISEWNVGKVANMNSAFNGAYYFDTKIGKWDTSSVTDMGFMFGYYNSFNQDIKKWDVKQVVNMEGMFYSAYNFDQPLDDWDVQSVISMEVMFNSATSFDQCLSTWAEKTSDTTETLDMLGDTSCPCLVNDIECASPDPTVDAPWCQVNVDTCKVGPDVVCEDDTDIKFFKRNKKNPKRTKTKKCKDIKSSDCNTNFNEKETAAEGNKKIKPKDFCPKTCSPDCADPCEEVVGKIKLKGKPGRFTCTEIGAEGFCETKIKNNPNKNEKAEVACPSTCNINGCSLEKSCDDLAGKTIRVKDVKGKLNCNQIKKEELCKSILKNGANKNGEAELDCPSKCKVDGCA